MQCFGHPDYVKPSLLTQRMHSRETARDTGTGPWMQFWNAESIDKWPIGICSHHQRGYAGAHKRGRP
jgi:hypothetical protein